MGLVLTRRIGETLCIGNDIKVTVLAVRGAQVRIDVSAPKTTVVDREEIRTRRDRDAEIAARLKP